MIVHENSRTFCNHDLWKTDLRQEKSYARINPHLSIQQLCQDSNTQTLKCTPQLVGWCISASSHAPTSAHAPKKLSLVSNGAGLLDKYIWGGAHQCHNQFGGLVFHPIGFLWTCELTEQRPCILGCCFLWVCGFTMYWAKRSTRISNTQLIKI